MNTELQVPSFESATEWLNRRITARQTKGHPTLVHFWSVSSEASKTNLAQVAQLRDQRKREGLRVVAVHVPQSNAEKDPRTVRDAIARLNLTEPCALDNDYKIFTDRKIFPSTSSSIPKARSALPQPEQTGSTRSKTNWTNCSLSCERKTHFAPRVSCS
jgi:hypothetical protein